MTKGLSTSRFNMWRALVAMTHADGVVTPHEISFLQQSLKEVPVSPEQMKTLSADLKDAQDIHALFRQITAAQDKQDFFTLGRVLCWSDGDFHEQEEKILVQLESDLKEGDREILISASRAAVQEIALDDSQWTPANDKKPGKGFPAYLAGILRRA